MQALIEGLNLTIERFASPLNFNCMMESFYSLYKEDECFGANHNAFSRLWVGASQCNPEYEHGDMEKAVRWALVSAIEADQPSLTAFVLPWWPDSAYFKWMDHPLVHSVARIKGRHFKFKRAEYSTKGQLYAGNPRWDINVFVVANRDGMDAYVDMEKLHAGLQHAAAEFNGPSPHIGSMEVDDLGEDEDWPLVHTPKALRKIVEQSNDYRMKSPHTWSCIRGCTI